MADKQYIERGAFLKKCAEAWGHYGVTIKAIEGIADECAAADVVEVMHGEWVAKDLIVRSPFARNHYCSVCQYEPIETKSYCPECGAKMDGERKDKP